MALPHAQIAADIDRLQNASEIDANTSELPKASVVLDQITNQLRSLDTLEIHPIEFIEYYNYQMMLK